MAFRIRNLPRRAWPHRLLSGVTLLAYLVAAIGFPVPESPAHSCGQQACGCGTSEQCQAGGCGCSQRARKRRRKINARFAVRRNRCRRNLAASRSRPRRRENPKTSSSAGWSALPPRSVGAGRRTGSAPRSRCLVRCRPIGSPVGFSVILFPLRSNLVRLSPRTFLIRRLALKRSERFSCRRLRCRSVHPSVIHHLVRAVCRRAAASFSFQGEGHPCARVAHLH